MLGRFKGRIISTSVFIFAIALWDSIYYGYYNYPFNAYLDLPYTIFIAILVWWLASYYDKSKLLLETLKESEEGLKKLSDTTNYVFENLNQAVFQVDHLGKITLLNPAWETLTGYSICESIGKEILSFVYPDDISGVEKRVLFQLDYNQETLQDEVRFRKKDGGFIWLQINMKLNYNSNGDFETAVGTLADITSWKTSESELLQLNENLSIQSDKLAIVAQMSAAIAHEVRNPLTSIFGFIQLLREQKSLNKEYIDIIVSEIERIDLVLSEMLVLSKPQAFALKKLDITKLLDNVITLVTTEANMKSVELKLHSMTKPVWISGEENRLKQVFINIIKNAIEALNHTGSIDIYYAEDADYISVYIKDNGVGIPKELLNKIGQPFYTSKEKGTGLGLTICFKIIENHKGKIHITSEAGVGSTFEIKLPLFKEVNTREEIIA